MKTFQRILVIIVIAISLLVLVLSVVGIFGIWRINTPLTLALDSLLEITEQSLLIIDQGLDTAVGVVDRLSQGMGEVHDIVDQINTTVQEGSPLIGGLSLLVGEDIRPAIKDVQDIFSQLRQAANSLNETAQTINLIPFVDISRVTEGTQSIVDLFDELNMRVDEFFTQLDQLKQDVSEQVIQPVQDQVSQIETDLNAMQDDMQQLQGDVGATYQLIVQLRANLPLIIDMVSWLLTVLLLWGVMAQAALIYIGLIYLRHGRINFLGEPDIPTEEPEEDHAESEE